MFYAAQLWTVTDDAGAVVPPPPSTGTSRRRSLVAIRGGWLRVPGALARLWREAFA